MEERWRELFKSERKRLKRNQTQVAHAAGIRQGMISQIERVPNYNPGFPTIQKALKGIGHTVPSFLARLGVNDAVDAMNFNLSVTGDEVAPQETKPNDSAQYMVERISLSYWRARRALAFVRQELTKARLELAKFETAARTDRGFASDDRAGSAGHAADDSEHDQGTREVPKEDDVAEATNTSEPTADELFADAERLAAKMIKRQQSLNRAAQSKPKTPKLSKKGPIRLEDRKQSRRR